MHTGSDLLETWIPDRGFEIERRKLKGPKADRRHLVASGGYGKKDKSLRFRIVCYHYGACS